MLRALGWEGLFSVQENMETRGRINVPDYAYFLDRGAFALGDAARTPETKFPHAIAVGDAKAWSVDFEAANTGSRPGETAIGQTLRYLERAKIQSNRKVRWAILSNGRVWRLYYADARSALDGYFEADLAEILALPGAQPKLAPVAGETDPAQSARLFKTFVLAFRREAFESDPELDGRTFHDFALAEGAQWEAKVRTNLSEVVFSEVFPGLIRGLAAADKKAPNPHACLSRGIAGSGAHRSLQAPVRPLCGRSRSVARARPQIRHLLAFRRSRQNRRAVGRRRRTQRKAQQSLGPLRESVSHHR